MEDIDLLLRRAGLGEVDDIDRFREGAFAITLVSKRALGRASQIIVKAITRHHFVEGTRLERMDLGA